jgi:hypothetical protein
VVICVSVSRRAQAFSVQSSFTDPCHETMMITASEEIISLIPPGSVPLPENKKWRTLQRAFLEKIDSATEALDDQQLFLLFSLVLGVRQPDTDGHSTTNLESLRLAHANPSGEGQYKHASRAGEDDYEEGDASAIAGSRRLITDLMEEATGYAMGPPAQQIIEVDFYWDFYGQIQVPVWAPFYIAGKAVHVLQDSFSHSIRADQDALHRIAHVLNYVDAIYAGFDEDRDGLAHSDHLDRCMAKDIEELVNGSVEASEELLHAALAQFGGAVNDEVEEVLDNWLVLLPGCTKENDFCGNARWLEAVRKDQTGPYVKEAFSCHSAMGSATSKNNLLTLLLLLF